MDLSSMLNGSSSKSNNSRRNSNIIANHLPASTAVPISKAVSLIIKKIGEATNRLKTKVTKN
jgi:hypothetical protein